MSQWTFIHSLQSGIILTERAENIPPKDTQYPGKEGIYLEAWRCGFINFPAEDGSHMISH